MVVSSSFTWVRLYAVDLPKLVKNLIMNPFPILLFYLGFAIILHYSCAGKNGKGILYGNF